MSTSTPKRPLVVVGYDASAAAHAAVLRGIERVGTTGRLIVVHSHGLPADYIGAPFYQEMLDQSADRAQTVMRDLEASIPQLSRIDYEPEIMPGDPADAISRIAEHRGADEIILGTRGVGRMRAVLGSVAHEVMHRARCPVTVIPERMATAHRESAAA